MRGGARAALRRALRRHREAAPRLAYAETLPAAGVGWVRTRCPKSIVAAGTIPEYGDAPRECLARPHHRLLPGTDAGALDLRGPDNASARIEPGVRTATGLFAMRTPAMFAP